MHHYTYMITNSAPKSFAKYYIGVRSCKCDPVDDPYMSSSKTIKNLNQINLTKHIISIWSTRKLALNHEIQLHEEYNVKSNNLFYNKSNQTITKFDTQGVTREPFSIQHRQHLSEALTGYIRGPMSAEHKQKISASIRGVKNPKSGEARRNIPRSKETRQKISDTKQNAKVVSCPHCDFKSNNPGMLARWHFDQCRYK